MTTKIAAQTAKSNAEETTRKNQRILSQLVDREILHNVSSMMQYLLEDTEGKFYDDCLNVSSKAQYTHEFQYCCGECGNSWEVENDEPQDEITILNSELSEYPSHCTECILVEGPYEIVSEESDSSEALEFWAVTSFFARKLEERGELVSEILDFHVWGRTTSGQSISMDSVIEDIANDMKILTGQESDWGE